MAKPLWFTPERQWRLVELAQEKDYMNQCVYRHRVCPELSHYWWHHHTKEVRAKAIPVEGRNGGGEKTGVFRTEWVKQEVQVAWVYRARLINRVAEAIIESWKAEDRERRAYEWKLEQQHPHDGTYGKYGRRFDPVTRDVFVSSRPEYYLEALGVHAFKHTRVALIRIPSTSVRLFVDVDGAV